MGYMGLASSLGLNSPDASNPFGCTACFCYGFSNTCSPAKDYVKDIKTSSFDYDDEDWATNSGKEVVYNKVLGSITGESSFSFPKKFLNGQRYSYNQHLKFQLKVTKPDEDSVLQNPGTLIIAGVGKDSRVIELSAALTSQGNPFPDASDQKYDFRIHESLFTPEIDPVTFISVLNNVTRIEIEYEGEASLDMVQLDSAKLTKWGDPGEEANWVEYCHAPNRTPLADRCVDHFTFGSTNANPYQPCKSCTCNQHSQVSKNHQSI